MRIGRLLRLAIGLSLASLLAACPSKTVSVLVNDVRQPISVTVIYPDRILEPVGLSVGNSLNLRERLKDVVAVEYRYDGHLCRLERDDLVRVRVNEYGEDEARLKDCRVS